MWTTAGFDCSGDDGELAGAARSVTGGAFKMIPLWVGDLMVPSEAMRASIHNVAAHAAHPHGILVMYVESIDVHGRLDSE